MLTWTPERDAAFAKESAQMAEAAKAAAATKRGPATADKPADPPAAAPDKVPVPASGVVVSDGKDAADKAKAPDAPELPDLSFLPESVRSKVHFDDDHALATVKSGWMAHSEATKRFTEAKALERDALNYRALVADEDAAAVVAKVLADKKAGRKVALPVDPTPEPELDTLDPTAIKSYIDSKAKAAEEAAAVRAKAEIRQDLDAPTVYRNAMNAAISAYAAEHAVEQDVMVEAVKLAAADNAGVEVYPEDVARLMGGYVRAARYAKATVTTTPTNKPVTGSGRTGTEAVTSPTGRGGTSTAHTISYPEHWVNGKPPRVETDAQAEMSLLYAMRRRLGPEVTLEDVRAGSGLR